MATFMIPIIVDAVCNRFIIKGQTFAINRTSTSGSFLRVGSVNVGSMVGRSGEVVEMVGRRGLDFCCLQETRWKGDGARTIEDAGKN